MRACSPEGRMSESGSLLLIPARRAYESCQGFQSLGLGVSTKQFEELRLEVLSLVMLFLPSDVSLDLGQRGLAYRESAVSLLPREMPELRKCLVDPL